MSLFKNICGNDYMKRDGKYGETHVPGPIGFHLAPFLANTDAERLYTRLTTVQLAPARHGSYGFRVWIAEAACLSTTFLRRSA
jgi:hypothetical protein